MSKAGTFLLVAALFGLLSASCVTGERYREKAEWEEGVSISGSEELLREIERFRESLEQSKTQPEEAPEFAYGDEAASTDFLELKGAGPGTGVEAEKVPPILEALPRPEPSPSPPVAEEVEKPAPPVHIVEKRPPTISEIAAEMESMSSANPSFKRALAALYLATGDSERAFLVARSTQADEEYWETLVRAAVSFRIGETDAAISLAGQVLREWKKQSPLKITKLALSKRIASYGVFEEYDGEWVVPRQEVLLYCEVDNFVSEKEDDGRYVSKLRVRIEIRDGKRLVWSWEPPEVVDRSRNIRNDLYIGTRFYVPSDLRPGEYQLRVRVTDVIGSKSAKEEVNLVVKSL